MRGAFLHPLKGVLPCKHHGHPLGAHQGATVTNHDLATRPTVRVVARPTADAQSDTLPDDQARGCVSVSLASRSSDSQAHRRRQRTVTHHGRRQIGERRANRHGDRRSGAGVCVGMGWGHIDRWRRFFAVAGWVMRARRDVDRDHHQATRPPSHQHNMPTHGRRCHHRHQAE